MGLTRQVVNVVFLLTVFVICSCSSAVSDEPVQDNTGVKITELSDRLKIEINGKLFTEYRFKDVAHPHFYPVIGPTGEVLVRRWPLETGMDGEYEQHDHPGHVGLWFGHMVNGSVSFWCGGKVHEKFVEITSGNDVGVIKSENKWIGDSNQVVCTDSRTYKFYNRTDGQMMDCEITIHAANEPVTFNDSREGAMAIRLAPSMAHNLDSRALGNPKFRLQRKPGEEGGHIVNSEGIRDAEAFGKRAAWCDYYGPLKGQMVGVAIFDHPQNPGHPTSWMVRDYGLFAANPFGISELSGKKGEKAGEITVPAGQSLTLKYRFYFHKGDEKQAKVAELYREYAASACPKEATKCSKASTECVIKDANSLKKD